MGKVKQVKCNVAGCTSGEEGGPFLTDEDCTTVSERTAELKKHVYQAHTIKVDDKNAEAEKMKAEASKIAAEAAKVSAEADRVRADRAGTRGSTEHGEKKAIMSRPTVEESISESDW